MSEEMNTGSGAPEEVSSKRRVGVYKQVVTPKKHRSADPRFDERFGPIKPSFERSYEFIDEIKQKELELLNKQTKSTKLPEEQKEQLVKAKTILQDQLRAKKYKNAIREVKREQRRTEASLVAKGKKPYYAKKAVLKQAVKEKQYAELAEKGRLEKWMAKKSKRKASKQRKQMPYRRMQTKEED